MDECKKCFSVNLESPQIEQLKNIKERSGKSQSAILSECVGFGLNNSSFYHQGTTLFLVKVRVDADALADFGRKLQNGELQTNRYLFTYCIKDDPTVGVSLWIADDRVHLDQLIAPHSRYYQEVISIEEVITPAESMQLIMASLS